MARLWIDPALAEEAVFLRVRQADVHPGEEQRDERADEWNREREALYAEPDRARRQRAFGELGQRWFERLGLARLLTDALQTTPRLFQALAEIRVRRALGVRDEGSDVFGAGSQARFELALAPARFLDPAALREFLVRECLYADDMLDPAFGYRSELGSGLQGERARTELVRDRLAVLWEARVRGRAAAHLGAEVPLRPPPAFARAFAGACGGNGTHGGDSAPPDIIALYQRATEGALDTFTLLLAAARGELEVPFENGSRCSSQSAAARAARTSMGSPT